MKLSVYPLSHFRRNRILVSFTYSALRENLWVNRVRLTAWTGWAHCRARTNIVPKPRDSVSDAGLADTHLASPAQPRIRIGLGTTVARILPAERPETCSRPPCVRRLRSAFGHVRRSRRAVDAEGAPADGRRNLHPARRHTSAFLAFDALPPAPVTHPLRRRTPVLTLASPSLGRRAGTGGMGGRPRTEDRGQDGDRGPADGWDRRRQGPAQAERAPSPIRIR